MEYEKQLENFSKACNLCGGYDNMFSAVMLLSSSDFIRENGSCDVLDDFYFMARENKGISIAEKYAVPELLDVWNDDMESERYALYDFINMYNNVPFYSDRYEQSIYDYLRDKNFLKDEYK